MRSDPDLCNRAPRTFRSTAAEARAGARPCCRGDQRRRRPASRSNPRRSGRSLDLSRPRLTLRQARCGNCVCHQRLRAKLPRHTNDHAARVASPSALRRAGTSETRAQRDPVSSLKYMGILNPSRRERGAGGKRRWAFGDRSRAAGQSPKGGWSLQTPLAHKEKGPARDLFSGLQCASGGGDGSDVGPSPATASLTGR